MTFARLLPHLLDRAAEAGPEREALTDGTVRLSYGDAAIRANRLAHLLVEEGSAAATGSASSCPAASNSAIAVYGILKAGAAFVPIDPSTPPAGIRQLLRDCDIRHLITHDSLAGALGEVQREATPLQCVVGPKSAPDGLRCRPWSDLDAADGGAAPDRRILADDLAYIMYSSGSTGRPKGIMHTHRSGLAYAQLSVDTYGVTPADRIANHSPLHFDMSTFGYFSSICAGATTVIIPEAYTKLAASLAQLIEAERLTIWYSVPLALIQLATRGGLDQRDLGTLRWVLFGGEPFPPDHLKALMQRLPGARFSNVYGPAEVNQCTYHHLPPVTDPTSEAARGLPVPIGDLWAEAEGIDPGRGGPAGHRRRARRAGRANLDHDAGLLGAARPECQGVLPPAGGRRRRARLLSHGRPGPAPRGRPARVPRPQGSPGENTRLPRGIGRDRAPFEPASGGRRMRPFFRSARTTAPGASRLPSRSTRATPTWRSCRRISARCFPGTRCRSVS